MRNYTPRPVVLAQQDSFLLVYPTRHITVTDEKVEKRNIFALEFSLVIVYLIIHSASK